tara:strand:- start:375 stop:1034 length:660 start_codon:yes stop_codon:yes gene_type:complete
MASENKDVINKDWANLYYYKEENLKLVREGIKESIIFMGDSITEEWGRIMPEFFSNKQYINRGIGGQTTPQMLIRFRQDVIDLNPKAVVILAGTNDIAGNTGPSSVKMIIDNLMSMAEIASKQNIQVFMSSILPVFRYPWNKSIIEPFKKIAKINSFMKNFSDREKLVYVDYHSHMVDSRPGLKLELTTDEVHLNQAGYIVMSEIVKRVIRDRLKRNLN